MNIRIALAGNPNSGKTTLFNALTGSNQFVGNWPGVTVEKKEGKLKKHDDVIITDLPGFANNLLEMPKSPQTRPKSSLQAFVIRITCLFIVQFCSPIIANLPIFVKPSERFRQKLAVAYKIFFMPARKVVFGLQPGRVLNDFHGIIISR